MRRLQTSSFRIAGALVLFIGASACEEETVEEPKEKTLLERATAALGGEAAVLAVTNERIEASGKRMDPGEAPAVGEILETSAFQYVLTAEVDAPRMTRELEHQTNILIPLAYAYGESIDGEHGWVNGADDMFEVLMGADPQQPMESSRITAHLKHTDMMSPVRLLRRALENPDAVTEGNAGDPIAPMLTLEEPGRQAVRIYLDPSTFLPLWAETLEDHPPLGDTLIQYAYEDYREVGVVKLPYRVTIEADGLPLQTEDRTLITTNVETSAEEFAVPAEMQTPFDAALGAYGERSTELLLGWQHLGFPLFFNDQSGAPSTFTELAPGVEVVFGLSHHSLLVELGDELVLVDTPLYEGRSKTVLDEITSRHPDKPLKTLVASHFHYDHVGGIRHYAAEGGMTVYAGAPSVPFFERIFENPHTVVRDRYEDNPVDVIIEGVSEKRSLTDGAMVIDIIPIDSMHSNDMLIVHLPAQRVLFNSDLFSPSPGTPPMPAQGTYGIVARELYDTIIDLDLEVDTIVGAHGPGVGTLEELRIAAGR